MSQCVPNWDLDDGLSHHSTTNTTNNVHAPMPDYVVSELTWEKGHLARHGLHGGPLQRVGKLAHKRPIPGAPSWEKPPTSGTLEAVVDQATRSLVHAAVDALVPSAKVHTDAGDLDHQRGSVVPDSAAGGAVGGGGRCVSSCSGRKRVRPGAGDSNRSATGSAASVGLAFDAWEIDGDGDGDGDGDEEAGFATSASPLEGSPETENASSGRALTTVSEGDDSYDSRRSQKDGSEEEEKSKNEKRRSSVSTKRIRAAAVHNQSERKRRDRINQRMRTLQKLVPNSSKTDKASILDEVIDYMKQLQAQVQMMSRMNSMPHMMVPMAMQQMQMAMMAQMAQMAQMGMAMGMGMTDLGQSGMPWAAFLPPSVSRHVPGRDPTQAPAGAFLPDPFAAFMAFQTQQPMTSMDAQSRMTALCQQLYQQPPGSSHETQRG